jgi:hypothetical protein
MSFSNGLKKPCKGIQALFCSAFTIPRIKSC